MKVRRLPYLLVVLLASCSSHLCSMEAAIGPVPPQYWPTQGFRTSTPEEQGVDSQALIGLLDYLSAEQIRVHNLLLVRNGYVVLDAHFWPHKGSDLHDIASCTKSVVSAVAGLAIEGGGQGLDQPLASLFPSRTIAEPERKEGITLRHLLTMTSGFACNSEGSEETLFAMMESPDWVQFGLDRPVALPPGRTFIYDSVGAHLVGAAIGSNGTSVAELAEKELFAPLGISNVVWPRDPQGVPRGWGDLQMTPYDMAKIGLLFLHKGSWEGKQVIPEEWARRSVSDHNTKAGPDGGYGYLWWPAGKDGFYAAGRGGQFIYVQRGLNLVAVTTGGIGRGPNAAFSTALERFVAPALVSSTAIPPNPKALAQLQSRVALLSLPPPARPVPPTPPAFEKISGRTFALSKNRLGWESLTLVTGASPTAELRVQVKGAPQSFEIGLDGVPRITADKTFAAEPRYEKARVALSGSWRGERTMIVEFDTLGLIENGLITLELKETELKASVFERTLLGSLGELTGRTD